MANYNSKKIMLIGLKGEKGDTGGTAPVVQTAGTATDKVMSQKAVTDELAKKANTDGYYSSLGAGTADQLNSPDGTIDNSQFCFRTTAGNESVSSGNAKIKSIKGNSIIYNQMVKRDTTHGYDVTKNGVRFVYNTDLSLKISGTSSGGSNYRLCNADFIKGHKYLFYSGILNSSWGSFDFYSAQLGGSSSAGESGNIVSCTESKQSAEILVNVWDGKTIDVVCYPRIIDLTKAFGAGKEPTSVADERIKTIIKYAVQHGVFSDGELISVKPSGIETIGFNQFDVSKTTDFGKYIESTGGLGTDSSTDVSAFIPVFPSTEYYFKNVIPISSHSSVGYWDRNKKFISRDGISSSNSTSASGVLTTPKNCFFLKICYPHNLANQCCVNLSWSGSKNGTYESYDKRTLAIDTLTYFPNGMRSVGDTHDEIDFDRRKAITRIGVVDLGTLNWSVEAVTGGDNFYAKPTPNAGSYTLTLCPEFVSERTTTDIRNNAWVSNSKNINISADGYNSSTSAFKAAMSGVYMFYILETPTEVDISESESNVYYENDWGTEELKQSESTPLTVPASLLYMRNLVDEIRNVRKNCLETGDSLDNLLTALGTACGGTFEKAWDDTDQEWKFTFTANA